MKFLRSKVTARMRLRQTGAQFWAGAVGGLLFILGIGAGAKAWKVPKAGYILPASGRSRPQTRDDVIFHAALVIVIGAVLLYYSFRGTAIKDAEEGDDSRTV
jgi:hypothetical protein